MFRLRLLLLILFRHELLKLRRVFHPFEELAAFLRREVVIRGRFAFVCGLAFNLSGSIFCRRFGVRLRDRIGSYDRRISGDDTAAIGFAFEEVSGAEKHEGLSLARSRLYAPMSGYEGHAAPYRDIVPPKRGVVNLPHRSQRGLKPCGNGTSTGHSPRKCPLRQTTRTADSVAVVIVIRP
jgi:hypothetical protein